MTSKRAYAVAALACAASVALGSCASGANPDRSGAPKATQAAYPQPAYRLTHEQLRSVTVVGARNVTSSPSVRTDDQSVFVGFCDDAYLGAEGRSWLANDETLEPQPGMPAGMGGGEGTQIGWTFTATTLLDDSPSAARLMDERIRTWSTCQPRDDTPVTTVKVDVPGAAASVVRTQVMQDVSPWNAHAASGVARVENALLSCTVNARTATQALATTTSCLTEMAQAVPWAAGSQVALTDANRVVAAKVFLAQVGAANEQVTVKPIGAATEPCKASPKTFLPVGTPFAILETSPPGAETKTSTQAPEILSILMAERADDAAAAKAKVTAARATFGGCRGTFSKGKAALAPTGKVLGVVDSTHGDGGFTITHSLQFRGQKRVETVHDVIFSVGPYVVEMTSTDPKNAQVIAARLTKVVGS